jgi:hypothetical protein
MKGRIYVGCTPTTPNIRRHCAAPLLDNSHSKPSSCKQPQAQRLDTEGQPRISAADGLLRIRLLMFEVALFEVEVLRGAG